ncbi:hypothetical protein FACS1894164_11450 [Spirochaetia bacterium]|nr:hypothetical protein FACS1894164_11450 [Spirochaetia bacterium]
MSTNQIENRQIRVFISSTFRDMHAERDYLITKVFPVIRRYAEDRDISFFEVDLRWGITDEQSKKGETLKICLEEIEKTNPFFIGLLGENYGSVPEKKVHKKIEKTGILNNYRLVKDDLDKGISFTEMEIQHGVLRNPEKINAYFYFRSPSIPTSQEIIESDSTLGKKLSIILAKIFVLFKFKKKKSDSAKKKLSALKYALREQKDYQVKDYISPEDLGASIEKDFKTLVDTLWPEGALSFFEKEQFEQKTYLKSRTKIYIPNEDTLQKLDRFINAQGEEAARFLVVTGEKGMGKSALLSNWIQRRQGQSEKLIYYFIGNSNSQGDYHKISEYFISALKSITGQFHDESIAEGDLKRTEKLTETLQDLLWTVAKTEKLILVLDGMDKLIDIDNAKLLNWMPAFPSNARVVFSTVVDDKTMDVFKRRNYPCITVEALPVEDRKKLVEDYLYEGFGKKLLPAQIKRIIDKGSKNTLALRVLSDELRILRSRREIDGSIDAYLATPDLESFYDKVVDRIEKTYSSAKTPDGRDIANFGGLVLALLAASRAGLTEHEILEITEAAPLYWSQLYNGMTGHLVKRNGLIVFDNWFIQTAAAKRKKDSGEEYRRRIISYMETASDISLDRKRDELPHQYFELKEWDKLYAFLLDFEVFYYIYTKDYIYTKNEYELGQYWRTLQKENKEKYSFVKYLALEESDKDEVAYYINTLGNFVGEVLADYAIELEFHQKACAILEKVLGSEHPDTAGSYNNIGVVYRDMGNYEKALEFYQKACAILEKVLGSEHPDTAGSYNNIGVVYRDMGNYEKALEFHQKARAIREKVLGLEHPDTAASYNNIGVVYDSMGDYEKALEFHQEARAIKEKVRGSEHPDTATSYNNIGAVYHGMGDYEKALEFHQEARAIREKVLGSEHPDTVASYNNIGAVYDSMGDYEKALEFHQKARAIREKVLGSEHPDTAESYSNIGGVYDSMGDYEKALEFHQKACAILEKVLGLEHPDTAASYNNIGGVYHDMGNYEKALEFYQKACAILEKVRGSEHPDTAGSYNNIGVVYHDMGNYEKALKFYQKALTIREKVCGLEHPDTAESYNNIGVVYSKMGNYEKALEFHQEARAIREKVLGLEHPDTAQSYNNIGGVYHDMGDYPTALEMYQKARAIREKVCGLEHPDTAASYNNIGLVYHDMGDYEKALEFHQEARAIREKVRGLEHPDTAESYNNIGLVYDSMGDYPTALEMYQKARAIREKVCGLEHPDTAQSYNNIGGVYHDMGDYPTALEMYQKARAIREKVLGLEHSLTARSYNNIGAVYHDMGDYEKALEFHQKARAIREKVLGLEHPATAQSYNNIGVVYFSMGDYEKALEFFQGKNVLPLERSDSVQSHNDNTSKHRDMGDYTAKLKMHQNVLATRQRVFGVENPETAQSYRSIGSVYEDMENYEMALAFYQKALAIMEKVLGKDHPDTATLYDDIGSVYEDMKNYEMALGFYEKAFPVFEKNFELDHPDTISIIQRIVELHELMGNTEKADVMQKKLGKQ